MPAINAVYDKSFVLSGLTATKDDWYDVSGAIASGKQLYLGFGIFVAQDKDLQFELRPNLATKSLGTLAETQLLPQTYCTAKVSEPSPTPDFTFNGQILTLAPVLGVSTGVEKLWLRVRSGTQTVGGWDCMIFYFDN